MLTPKLATDDPYRAAYRFVAAGWSLIFQPWGERAFHAVLGGYRFLVAAENG